MPRYFGKITLNIYLQISTFFLAQLAFGSAILMPFFPLKSTGKSFVRFYYGFIAIFLGLFLLGLQRLGQFHLNYALICSLSAWIWLLSFTKDFSKNETFLQIFFAFVSLIVLFVYPQKFLFQDMSAVSYIFPYMLILFTALFLAFYLMNMIFGHWYLVNRSLPMEHLIKTSKFLLYLTYLKIAIVALATYKIYEANPDTFTQFISLTNHGIFFWGRILAGLGVPLVAAHLSYESAKIKSNQSATGILYAGVIFVLMGELLGLYLFSITGIIF